MIELIEFFALYFAIFAGWGAVWFEAGRRHEKWIKREIKGGNRK